MTVYIFDYRTHEARFYLSDGYVYGMSDNLPHYSISESYWYKYPSGANASFWQQDKYIYSYPSGVEPDFYYS